MNTELKPFKQGELDRFCGIYALINAVRSTGFKLTQSQAQAVMDDIVENLASDDLTALMLNGAEHKELMKLARRFNRSLDTLFDKQVELIRPYKNKSPDFETVLCDMEYERSCNNGVIVRIFSNAFDHYSVFDRVDDQRIRFIDSAHIASLPLSDLSDGYQTKYTLRVDDVYFLRPVKI